MSAWSTRPLPNDNASAATRPDLVRTLPFLLPMFSRDGLIPRKLSRALGSAMWAYDLTGGARIGKLHQRLSVDEAMAHMPTLPRDRLASSYLYYDTQADDARLTLAIARTAALDHGAVVVTRAEVVALGGTDHIRSVQVRAEAPGGRGGVVEISIDTRAVVNATGVWADDVRALDEGTHPGTIRPARGVHLTVPWEKVRCDIAVVLPVVRDRRSVFVVPWEGAAYIGTTDTDDGGSLDDPRCTPDDVDYLLGAVNTWLEDPITPGDVLGTWAGLRPLVSAPDSPAGEGLPGGTPPDRTADLSRRHRVTTSSRGMVTVTGGKLTTYRQMAADAVDAVLDDLGATVADRVLHRCPTRDLPLRGAAGFAEAATATVAGLDGAQVAHLASRYGGEAAVLHAMVERDASLARALVPGLPYLRAEALYALRYEMATSIDDVLDRRTRARLLDREATASAAPAVAELMGEELGWGSAHRDGAVGAYQAEVAAEANDLITSPDAPETALDAALGA